MIALLLAAASGPISAPLEAAGATGAAAVEAPVVEPAAAPTAPIAADKAASSDIDSAPRFRSGIVLGGSLGAGVGQASGYPNNVQDIGNPLKHSSSGWLPGTSETVLLMGALADYLNFGLWYSRATFQDADQHANRWGVGLRLEAFPLVDAYPRLKGLGCFASFGLGSGKLTTAQPGVPDAEGTQSFIGVGAFYEWAFGHVFGGHFAIGPSLEYDAVWSRPFESSGLVASARVVFYGGP